MKQREYSNLTQNEMRLVIYLTVSLNFQHSEVTQQGNKTPIKVVATYPYMGHRTHHDCTCNYLFPVEGRPHLHSLRQANLANALA